MSVNSAHLQYSESISFIATEGLLENTEVEDNGLTVMVTFHDGYLAFWNEIDNMEIFSLL